MDKSIFPRGLFDMEKITLNKLTKEERKNFFQSKYDYYKAFNARMIIVAILAYLSFFITDCNIFGHFATETFVPRMIVILPLIAYFVLSKRQVIIALWFL